MSSPKFIPPINAQGPNIKAPPRNLIFMFDGTGDEIDDDVTNVIQFSRLLYNHPKELDPTVDKKTGEPKTFVVAPVVDSDEGNKRQVIFYRKGIGMWKAGSNRSKIPFYGPVSRTVDKAIAWNFEDHVMDAYKTLTEQYKEGDKICLFGFSRGSYTARTKSFSPDSINEFHVKLKEFLEQHRTAMVMIEFVGVWDTVNSVGLITTTGAMYTSSAPNLKTFRHAIALDERRARFDRSMWYKKENDGKKLKTDVEQVWFAGAHCDVGGGSVSNDTKPNLANIPLRWMIRECFKKETGIIFAANELQSHLGMDPLCLYPIVKPRPAPLPLRDDSIVQTVESVNKSNSEKKCPVTATSTEEEHDLWDSLAPIYDMLVIKWYTWDLFERFRMKKWDPVRGNTHEANWWAGRRIYVNVPPSKEAKKYIFDKKVRVHRSVRTRMMAKSMDPKGPYVPAASLQVGGQNISVDSDLVEWVD
ncbi:hypothetical protein D9758_009287 [Tetrapyrgos nigripes]|uniref:T6SS Phospholipase effector Tle1-like catalytic domain-containing protein n=1 Tax=Tetrapyrgos nigripes TaxID=182062 RepID=A0A8H5GGV8_9AGAR|nr:hypothetical protein D9758_009287 [Tetrapyrgos nigripes]